MNNVGPDPIIVQEEFEQIDESILDVNLEELVEDLNHLRDKFESHQCNERTAEFAEGFEAGLFHASNLLIELLEQKRLNR